VNKKAFCYAAAADGLYKTYQPKAFVFLDLPNCYSKVVKQWEAGKNDPRQKPAYPPEFEQAYKKFLDKKY